MGMPQATKSGIDVWEAASAMQKHIRRGEERQALFFALDMCLGGLFNFAANRLKVIAQEDIGMADMRAVLFVGQALECAAHWYKGNNEAWTMGITNAVLALARAKKCRTADTAQAATRLLIATGRGYPVPDYALDKHTRRGKAMGRGLDHFLEVGTRLNPQPAPDGYEKEAAEFWRLPKQEAEEPSEAGSERPT